MFIYVSRWFVDNDGLFVFFECNSVYPRVSHFIPCVMRNMQTNFMNVERAVSEDS